MILRRQQLGVPAARRAVQGQVVELPPTLPPARLQSSQPGALGPEQGQWVRLPGVNYPPAGATPVNAVGDADIAPGASAVLVTIAVPAAQRFRLAGIGFQAEDETALSFLTWSLRAPDPMPGYVGTPAAVGSVRQLADIFLLVGSNATVTVVGASAAGAVVTYHFFCRVHGWFYAEKEV